MTYRTFVFCCLMLCSSVALGQTTRRAPSTRPVEGIKRVMIVSIDGLRPDLALRAETPNLHALLQAGTYTFWARTTAVAITLPSHVSMLTGVTPRKHEIEWNVDLPLSKPFFPTFPTLFEIAHNGGYSTGMAAGKSKFIALNKPGTVDWVTLPDQPTAGDADVTRSAVAMIHDHQPAVMFVHLAGVDNVGHAKGWASHEQLTAIHEADAALGKILDAARDAKTLDETLLIVTADHGGAGRTHGPDDARSRHIPWIAVGPGVRADYDLTRLADLTVDTEDTCATACYVLGLTPPRAVDGKPILAIFEKPDELLVSTPKAK